MLEAVGVAFGLVFVAEIGDKSQLLTLTFAARYRWPVVLLGVSLATAGLMVLSVAAGGLIGGALPRRPLQVVAGLTFLAFAVWTLRDADDDDGTDERTGTRRRPLGTIVTAFALAELGDKTMLTTIALASTSDAVGTWIGATAGMVGANALALVLGDQIGARLAPRTVTLAAAATFAVVGVALLVGLG